jgi:hypothetical protein
MAITKIYKGTAKLADVLKIYKGSELVYEKEEEPSYPTNVVVFKSDSPRTITPNFTQSGVTLQYSIDNGSTWNNISSGVTTASSKVIWFRGRATGTKSLYTSRTSSNAWVFSGDASNKLRVYGDLRYLLCNNLGDNTITFNIASYCYSFMFRNCTSLTTAPSLPATTLADYCYASMFSDCTSLTTAPSLPATTLADYCYASMFRNCTSLTTAPSLPATTLANYCYSSMFNGCTSLTTAPSLPATTLAESCYASMFSDCTSLTTAPSLPATTLAEHCYSNMFSGCTSLTTAPSLPATTLANYCYSSMFNGCTAFKVSTTNTGSYQYSWRIPTSGTGTYVPYWNYNMLKNTGGTFKSNPDINITYYVENPPV